MALEWLDCLSVSIGVPSLSPSDARGTIELGNVEIFGDFLGVLLFPQFHPTNLLHFTIPPVYLI